MLKCELFQQFNNYALRSFKLSFNKKIIIEMIFKVIIIKINKFIYKMNYN